MVVSVQEWVLKALCDLSRQKKWAEPPVSLFTFFFIFKYEDATLEQQFYLASFGSGLKESQAFLVLHLDIEMLFIVETTTPATAFYLVVFPRKQQFKQCFSSVQFSLSVVSNSLQPRGLQHARPPCPSATPGACSNSCPSSQ